MRFMDLSGVRISEHVDFSYGDLESFSRRNERLGDSRNFDIFLSHSAHSDKAKMESIKLAKQLENRTSETVYIDWRDDPELDRSNVTSSNAKVIRNRILGSRRLIYAVTPDSIDSRWCQWELGVADGAEIECLIFPYSLSKNVVLPEDAMIEFLEIYPYIGWSKTYPGKWAKFNPETASEISVLSDYISCLENILRH